MRPYVAAGVTVGSCLGLLVVSAACVSDSGPDDCALTVSVPDTVAVDQAGAVPLNAQVRNCHGDRTTADLRYFTDQAAIARVSSEGIVTGYRGGTTTLHIEATGLSRSVTIEVFGHPSVGMQFDVPLADAPFGVAASSHGIVYVTQIGSNSLARSNIPVTGFAGTITVGVTPAHVVFNPPGTTAYVTNQSSNSVSVVNVATHTESTAIPLGHSAFNLAVSPDGSALYATVDMGNVYRINTLTNTVVDSFNVGPVPNGLAFSPDGAELYISSRDSGWVVVYNTATATMIDTMVTGGSPQRLAVSKDGNELYIANQVVGIDFWDLNTRSRIKSLGAPGAYGLALSPDGTLLLVSMPSTGNVAPVDPVLRGVTGGIPTGGTPRNIVFSRYGNEAIITNEAGYVTVLH